MLDWLFEFVGLFYLNSIPTIRYQYVLFYVQIYYTVPNLIDYVNAWCYVGLCACHQTLFQTVKCYFQNNWKTLLTLWNSVWHAHRPIITTCMSLNLRIIFYFVRRENQVKICVGMVWTWTLRLIYINFCRKVLRGATVLIDYDVPKRFGVFQDQLKAFAKEEFE